MTKATKESLMKVIWRVFHGWNGDDGRLRIDMEKNITS